jgi:AraC family transcriptional activator of pobA
MQQSFGTNIKNDETLGKQRGFFNDLGVTVCDGHGSFFDCPGQRGSNYYSLVLLVKGALDLEDGETVLGLKEKDAVFFFPDAVHLIDKFKNIEFIRVDFNRDYLKKQGIFLGTAHAYQIFRGSPVQRFSLTEEEFAELYRDMLALEQKLKISNVVPYAADIIRNSFIGVVYDLFMINNVRAGFELPRQDSKIELTGRFFNLLAKNFRKEKSVGYYASELFVTPRHLSWVLKEVTGKTAGALVDEMVIKEAKLLLTGHDLNISQVAVKLYFSNSSFFGKYFKKLTGISPSAYKISSQLAI